MLPSYLPFCHRFVWIYMLFCPATFSITERVPSVSRDNECSWSSLFFPIFYAIFLVSCTLYIMTATLTLVYGFSLNFIYSFTLKCTRNFFSPFLGLILLNLNIKKEDFPKKTRVYWKYTVETCHLFSWKAVDTFHWYVKKFLFWDLILLTVYDSK